MRIEDQKDYKTIGHGDMMELLIETSDKIHVNSTGRGTIILKTNEPCVLYFLRTNAKSAVGDKASENLNLITHDDLQPLINFQNEKLAVEKVRERLYDFTIPNEKIIEIHFDELLDPESIKNFDEKLVSLGLENEATFRSTDKDEGASKVSDFIEKGGELLCKGIDVSSYWIGIGICKSGKALKSNMKPLTLDEAKTERPKWEKRLSSASNLSSSVRSSTKSFSNSVSNTFSYVIDKSIGKSMKTGSPAARSTARVSLKIIDSFADAGEHIISTSKNTTTELFKYRYGTDSSIVSN